MLGLHSVDLLDRHVRQRCPGDAAVGEHVQCGDIVGEVRAAGAQRVRAEVHELVHHQLAVVAEQVTQGHAARCRGEGVRAERDHRQAPPSRCECDLGARCLLFRDQQLLASLLAFAGGYDLRDRHAVESGTGRNSLLQDRRIPDRPLMPHERSNSPPERIPPSEPTTSLSRGYLRIPSRWTSRYPSAPPGGGRVGELIRSSTHRCDDRRPTDNRSRRDGMFRRAHLDRQAVACLC